MLLSNRWKGTKNSAPDSMLLLGHENFLAALLTHQRAQFRIFLGRIFRHHDGPRLFSASALQKIYEFTSVRHGLK